MKESSMKKITTTIAVLSTSAALVAAPALAVTASAAPVTKLIQCNASSVAPKKIIIACADANRWISKISWTAWGSAVAHGSGTLNWNNCTPTCVAGTYRSKPITFTALAKKNNVYTELRGPKGSFGDNSTIWSLVA